MLTFRSVEGGWYKQYEESLKEEGYKRDLYNAIAVLIIPSSYAHFKTWLSNNDKELFDFLEIYIDKII